MKYFICGLDEINLGIPAGYTERIIQVARAQACVHENENQDSYISIPVLFGQKDVSAPHGLVLKRSASGPGKKILLTPKIEIDLEIPEQDIHRLPGAFAGVFAFVKGACFAGSADKMILILDPEKLLEKYHD